MTHVPNTGPRSTNSNIVRGFTASGRHPRVQRKQTCLWLALVLLASAVGVAEAKHVRASGGWWSQIGANLVVNGEGLGSWVAMSADGDTVIVSAGGHARVFTRAGAEWQQLGSDIDGGPVAMSADGLTVIIGHPSG